MDQASRPSDKHNAFIVTGWPQAFLSAEAVLWLALAVFSSFREPWKLAGLVVVPLVSHHFHRPRGRANRQGGARSTVWRQPTSSADHRDAQGTFAGTILVPVLLSAMSRQTPDGDLLEGLALSFLTLMFDFKAASWIQCIPDAVRLVLALFLFSSHKLIWNRTLLLSVVILHASYHSIRIVPTLHGAFTNGEWKIVSSLAAAALTAWLLSSDRRESDAPGDLHNDVAFTGVASSLATFAILALAPSRWLPLTAKFACLTLTPLASVEVLFLVQSGHLSFPRSIVWLTRFLLETEGSSRIPDEEASPWIRRIATLPRYYWLVYWIAVLAITLAPAAYASYTEERMRIVARKWFHLVAVLLFAPVTLAAPQLQSLSYAIALAVLMVLESIRTSVPALNAFYCRFLDPVKDERGEHIVVSHMALVVGCAAPLWIAEFCSWTPNSVAVKSFLSLWGVLSLGVGDAMGAVVGIHFGRHRWGAGNPRSIEGSLAMFLSVAIPSWLLLGATAIWVPAIAFATLVEAWTIQLDNLILPLSGSSVVLLLHQQRL